MAKRDIVPSGEISAEGGDVILAEPVRQIIDVENPETDDEAESAGPDKNWTFWSNQIKAGLVNERRFRNEAIACEALYFGEDKDTGAKDGEKENLTEIPDDVAIVHSTIEVLKPLVFSETPQPVVRRRWHGDGKADETDLMAAEAAQRLAEYMLDTEDFDEAMKGARDDWLIAGRGQARVIYKYEVAEDGLTKINERACPRHTPWLRFLTGPAEAWKLTPWCAFEVPMTRTAIERRFPDHADRFSYNTKGLVMSSKGIDDQDFDHGGLTSADDESGAPTHSPFDTAMVWEIHNKETREVIWWSNACPEILDKEPDFLNLEDFYPCPPPLLATTKSGNPNPRPDIRYYQKSADEIKIASRKLRSILNTISISALVPGSMSDDLKKILQGDNIIVAVTDWIALMEKGGTSSIIQWLPIQQIAAAAQALDALRRQAKEMMFEANGVSDIMRSQGDPNETATAQQIKGRYAGLRLSDRQRSMAIFALKMLRMMIEIGVEKFSTENLAEMTGLDIPLSEAERQAMIQQQEMQKQIFQKQMELFQMGQQIGVNPGQPPVPPEFEKIPETSWELVHARLRNDITRKITISIETSSTVLADEQADKEARIEFLGAFSSFVRELAPLASIGQIDMKTVKELLLFGVRGFPKSRTLESMIAAIPDKPTGEPKEDTAVIVAKIKAATDKAIEEMQQANNQKDRDHEIKLKGVDLIEHAADKMAEPPQEPPQKAKA